MRILIEEYQYNVTDVKDTLYGIDALENVEGKVSVHYVGYYYNTLQRDCVFIGQTQVWKHLRLPANRRRLPDS